MLKRGAKRILKPDFWNREFYLQQKEIGVSDLDLANQLFISIYTLYRWKKELGFQAGDFKHIRLANQKKPH